MKINDPPKPSSLKSPLFLPLALSLFPKPFPSKLANKALDISKMLGSLFGL